MGRTVLEGVDFTMRPAGKNRMTRVRNATYPAICLGYAEATPQYFPLLRSARVTIYFDSGEGIAIFADDGGIALNGNTITFTEVAAAGLPTAAWQGTPGDSNIVVTVNTTGTTTIAEIATALDDLAGISSTTNTGDYTDGVDNAIVGTFAGGHAAQSISAANGFEVVNLEDMPDEWWALVNTNSANVRVTDEDNNAIPFDIDPLAFNKAAQTGYLVLHRAISGTVSEPVRCWVCLQSVAKFPMGSEFGQFASYPAWMLAWWPTGYNRTRTSFDIPAPAGPADPFQLDVDPGPGSDDNECQSATEPYLVTGVFEAIGDANIMWLSTINNDQCAAPADEDAQAFGYINQGNESGAVFMDFYQLEWHPTAVTLNETSLGGTYDAPGDGFGQFFTAALKLKTVLGWELDALQGGSWVSVFDSAIPDDPQTSITFGDTNEKIADTDFATATSETPWITLNSIGRILFKAIIQNSTDFEELDAMSHLYAQMNNATNPGTNFGDWATASNQEYWGGWDWIDTGPTQLPDG